MTALRFSLADVEVAHDKWGANCGPAALAAVCGLTLDQVRSHLNGFTAKGYTNPTMMFRALDSLGVAWQRRSDSRWPDHGLARIQWEGPWTAPGVPIRARYRHTHWVGSWHSSRNGVGIFDVNAMNSGGRIALRDWERITVPWILQECVPRASGTWHITHAIEVP